MKNPGNSIVGKKQMLRGGDSEPRNANIMKMLNLLGFGEHSGNGVPDIFSIWDEAGFPEPVIEEHFGEDGPAKTIITLPLMNKTTKKSDEKKATEKVGEKKITSKTLAQMNAILANMVPGEWYRSSDLMGILDLKETRTKDLLRLMVKQGKIVDDGATKGKRYQKNEQ